MNVQDNHCEQKTFSFFIYYISLYYTPKETFHKYPYKKKRNYLKSLTRLTLRIFNELKFANSRYMSFGKEKKKRI